MAEVSIASAIVAAEPIADESTTTNVLKRRQSEEAEEEQESKRQRTSPGKNSPIAPKEDAEQAENAAGKEAAAAAQEQPTEESGPARRRTSIADEKQRSKRLFGALLGNLNQPRDRTSKRRQEIESRKKAELQRQDDERLEDKLRRQEKLAERRKREQEKVDEENMRIRHRNLLHTANFLQTTTAPKLYYRPWDLRADEEDRIEAQLKEAQARIDEELDEFNARQHRNGNPVDEVDAKPAPTEEPTKSPVHELQPSPEASAGAKVEVDKLSEEDADGQAPAKSEESKADEVPDSDPTNTHANGNESHESMVDQDDPVGNVVEEQEDGDHIGNDDADAVIY